MLTILSRHPILYPYCPWECSVGLLGAAMVGPTTSVPPKTTPTSHCEQDCTCTHSAPHPPLAPYLHYLHPKAPPLIEEITAVIGHLKISSPQKKLRGQIEDVVPTMKARWLRPWDTISAGAPGGPISRAHGWRVMGGRRASRRVSVGGLAAAAIGARARSVLTSCPIGGRLEEGALPPCCV